ncbi:MAG: hypothetical protein IJ594_07590 [Oscillospiraceae bacterium]|nr:hypothetical protein [Oscillospiraceae bacterium]
MRKKHIRFCLLLLLLTVRLAGCAAQEPGREETAQREEALSLARACRDACLSEKSARVRAVLDALRERGVAAADVAGRYPFVNPEAVESVMRVGAPEAELRIVRVCEDGGWIDTRLCRAAGGEFCRMLRIAWQEGEPVVTYDLAYPLSEWKLTDKGYLIYTCAIPDNTAESDHDGYIEPTTMLRLVPLDAECREWTERVLLPVGYRGHTLFTTDWVSPELQPVSLNELFPALYRAETGTILSYYDDPWPTEEQRDITLVPAEAFETLLQRYFDLDQDEIRACAVYDERMGAYPVPIQSLHGPAETPVPEVVAVRYGGDGTVTLTVDALFVEHATDRAFTHVLTVRPDEDGRCVFLANRLLQDKEDAPA